MSVARTRGLPYSHARFLAGMRPTGVSTVTTRVPRRSTPPGYPTITSLWFFLALAGKSRHARDRCRCARGWHASCTRCGAWGRRARSPRRARRAGLAGWGHSSTRAERVTVAQVTGHGVVVDHECLFGWRTGLVTNGRRRVRTSGRIRQGCPRGGDESERRDQNCNYAWSMQLTFSFCTS